MVSDAQPDTQNDPMLVETDPVEYVMQAFLGAATSLFVELGFLLVRSILEIVLGVIFLAGVALFAMQKPRWFGAGMMAGSAVPVILVLAFVPADRRQDLHHGQIPSSHAVVRVHPVTTRPV